MNSRRGVFLLLSLVAIAGLGLALGCPQPAPAPAPSPAPAPKPSPAPAPAPAPSPAPAPAPAQPFPKTVVMTTPAVGGALQIYGATMATLIEKFTKVVASPQPCTGAAEATELMVKGESQMASINGHNALSAYTGIAPFKKTPEIIRGFTGAYRSYAHFIVRADSGIKSIADLKGKRCMFDRPGEPIFTELYPAALKAYGLSTSDVRIMPALGYAESSQALREGTADATLQYSAIPSPQFLDMSRNTPILILPIEPAKQAEIQKTCAYLVAGTVGGGVYNVTPNATPTLFVPAGAFIRKDLSDDFIYAAIKGICTNIADLNNAHAMFKTWTPKDLASDPIIPYHAGAYKYYKEAGLLTPEWDKKHQDMLAQGGQKS